MKIRVFAALALLLLAGCTAGPKPRTAPEAKVELGRFEPAAGRGPEIVAELRAAPAPLEPVQEQGTDLYSDQERLSAQGLVHIGTGYYAGAESKARAWALQQAQRVGAEMVLLYPAPSTPNTDSAVPAFSAAYFVRFKLPFGANFRDLSQSERQALAIDGGVAIASVMAGTPAALANLQTGDVILKVNGKPVVNRGDFRAILRANAGKLVKLRIRRGDEEFERPLRLGAMPGV